MAYKLMCLLIVDDSYYYTTSFFVHFLFRLYFSPLFFLGHSWKIPETWVFEIQTWVFSISTWVFMSKTWVLFNFFPFLSFLLDMAVKTLKTKIITRSLFFENPGNLSFPKFWLSYLKKAEFPVNTEFVSYLSFCPKSEKKSLVLLSKQFSLPELLRCTTARKLVAFFPNGVSTSW